MAFTKDSLGTFPACRTSMAYAVTVDTSNSGFGVFKFNATRHALQTGVKDPIQSQPNVPIDTSTHVLEGSCYCKHCHDRPPQALKSRMR
eukprot:3732305-Pyramimonas_sp.AAC.1